MGYLKKYSFEVIIASIITLLYFTPRLAKIFDLPIFTDEAIYIRWAQIAFNDANWRFISLTDGKQPLFIWIIVLMMRFISNPLLAGRIVSVIAGFFTLTGLFFLGREAFKNRYIGLISSFLYVIYPFALVYDRMALYDSLVGTFAIWGLFLTIKLARTANLNYAIFLGVIGGLGVLNKTSGFFVVYLLPFSLILFDYKKKLDIRPILRFIILSAFSAAIVFGIYSILRLSPFFYIISQKDATFIYPFQEWIKHPITYFWDNLWVGQRDWFLKYFTIPFTVLVLVSFIAEKKYFKEKLLLIAWFFVPFIALALFGKTLYPRYILFMTLSLIPLVSYATYYIMKKMDSLILKIAFMSAIILVALYKDYFILNNFHKAPIPQSDVSQYYTDWPSGYGIQETINYLKQTEKNKVMLYTQGTFGLMPDAYTIYLHDDPQFDIKGIWPINSDIPEELIVSSKSFSTYIVFYQECSQCPGKGIAPDSWQLREVLRIKKLAPDAWLTLYKIENE